MNNNSNTSSLFGNPSSVNTAAATTSHTKSTASRPLHQRSSPSVAHQQTSGPSSSSAKRTRLEGSPAGLSPTVNAGARPANLVPLVTPKMPLLSSPVSPIPSGNKQKHSRTSAAVISMKLSGMKVDNHSHPEVHSGASNAPHKPTTSLLWCGSLTKWYYVSDASNEAPGAPEDILICGQCRGFFESVDALVAHKSAGCPLASSSASQCRCKQGKPKHILVFSDLEKGNKLPQLKQV